MSIQLLDKTRKINKLLHNNDSHKVIFNDICEVLSSILMSDILVISKDVPGVVIGHPVADCPVVMVSDSRRGVSAIGHCSCELIDKRLRMMVADALVDAYGSYD